MHTSPCTVLVWGGTGILQTLAAKHMGCMLGQLWTAVDYVLTISPNSLTPYPPPLTIHQLPPLSQFPPHTQHFHHGEQQQPGGRVRRRSYGR